MSPKDFKGRDDFKDAVFDSVEAGITGVDFAVAESGTLGLIHDEDQARLISLSPILHIAIVPVERIFPVYESVVERVFKKEKFPSQFIFITGPSMTGDIQGHLFKGMHGPRRVIVILVGEPLKDLE
jgi:L-lactate dehydrogenase complex protein LldG